MQDEGELSVKLPPHHHHSFSSWWNGRRSSKGSLFLTMMDPLAPSLVSLSLWSFFLKKVRSFRMTKKKELDHIFSRPPILPLLFLRDDPASSSRSSSCIFIYIPSIHIGYGYKRKCIGEERRTIHQMRSLGARNQLTKRRLINFLSLLYTFIWAQRIL